MHGGYVGNRGRGESATVSRTRFAGEPVQWQTRGQIDGIQVGPADEQPVRCRSRSKFFRKDVLRCLNPFPH